ncbi:MAG: hypothetical protein HYY85_08995 [Deltaproteobacteria bacterium]|nr:hypothetical protein [Deltaproteobacteria bacterium]
MGTCLRSTSLVSLVLTAALLAGSAWGAQPLAKADQELGAQGQKIDQAAAPAESSRVTARIVDQWRGTSFRFDATGTPRPLTAQDVQNLRDKGLGYGEISILLALTAHQPDPATAKSLNEVLARRQAGMGWGELARELGYRNLGSVIKHAKTTRKGVGQGATPVSPEEPEKNAGTGTTPGTATTPPGTGTATPSPTPTTSTARAELKIKLGDSVPQTRVDQILALVSGAAGDTGRVKVETEPGGTKIKAQRVSLTSEQVVSLVQAVETAGGRAELKMEHVVLSEADLKALVDSLATAPAGLKVKLEGRTTEGLPFELKVRTKKGEMEVKLEGAGLDEKVEKVKRAKKLEKPEKVEKAEKPERVKKAERREKAERADKVERVERVEKVERPNRPERVERREREEHRAERVEKVERSDRLERVERREREERHRGKD